MNFILNLPIKKYLRATILSSLLSLVLLTLISIVFSFFPPSDMLLDALCRYFFLFPTFTAAFLCGRASSGGGLLTGLVSSAIYMLLLIMLGGIFFKTALPGDKILKILIPGLLCGGIGGILGINFK